MNNELYFIGFGIFYFFYLVEICVSKTLQLLSNKWNKRKIKKHINDCRNCTPKLKWKVDCYHWETEY